MWCEQGPSEWPLRRFVRRGCPLVALFHSKCDCVLPRATVGGLRTRWTWPWRGTALGVWCSTRLPDSACFSKWPGIRKDREGGSDVHWNLASVAHDWGPSSRRRLRPPCLSLGSGQCQKISLCGHAELSPRRLLPLGARRSGRLVGGREGTVQLGDRAIARAGRTLVLAPDTAWRHGGAP